MPWLSLPLVKHQQLCMQHDLFWRFLESRGHRDVLRVFSEVVFPMGQRYNAVWVSSGKGISLFPSGGVEAMPARTFPILKLGPPILMKVPIHWGVDIAVSQGERVWI